MLKTDGVGAIPVAQFEVDAAAGVIVIVHVALGAKVVPQVVLHVEPVGKVGTGSGIDKPVAVPSPMFVMVTYLL